MGAAQSSRKITVMNDDVQGVIKISDAVVERLKGEMAAKDEEARRKKVEAEEEARRAREPPPTPTPAPPVVEAAPPAPVPEPAPAPPPVEIPVPLVEAAPEPTPEIVLATAAAPAPVVEAPPVVEVVPPVVEAVPPVVEAPPVVEVPPVAEVVLPVVEAPPVAEVAPPVVEAPPVAEVVPPVVPHLVYARPIIQYVEEPSISALRVRQEKEQEMMALQEQWQDRLAKLEEAHRRESTVKKEQIEASVGLVHNLFKPAPSREVCRSGRQAVQDCYSSNPSKPLLCRDMVLEFSKCVRESRGDVLAQQLQG